MEIKPIKTEVDYEAAPEGNRTTLGGKLWFAGRG